jgi:hypothetical protein
MLSSAKWVVKSFPSMVSVGIQWNSFALISKLFSQEKMFFPKNGSPDVLFCHSLWLLGSWVEEQILSSWVLEAWIGLRGVDHYHFLDFLVPVGQSGVGLFIGLIELQCQVGSPD